MRDALSEQCQQRRMDEAELQLVNIIDSWSAKPETANYEESTSARLRPSDSLLSTTKVELRLISSHDYVVTQCNMAPEALFAPPSFSFLGVSRLLEVPGFQPVVTALLSSHP